MTVIFPILQTQIENNTHDISEIYILPHDPMQFDSYNNTVVLQTTHDNTHSSNNNLLNFTVPSQNIIYNFTEQNKLNFNQIQSKIYKISDQDHIIENASTNINEQPIFNNLNDIVFTNDKQKNVLTASELELNPSFEITSNLKNYATVNVLEPIPTQISYNIGTESVGVDESIKNTESMTLEESSIISEIEKTNNIFDTISNANILAQKDKFVEEFFGTSDENFNSLFIEPKGTIEKDSNFIYPEVDLIDLNKQIRTTEAIEMSLVCEEETPSQWIDVMSLARNTTGLYEPPSFNENPLSAIPTAIQSYIDIESPKNTLNYQNNELYNMFNDNFVLNEQTEKEIEGVINETFKKIDGNKDNLELTNKENCNRRNRNENLLKNLTAEANICSCTDCKCGPDNTCNDDDSCYSTKNSIITQNKVILNESKGSKCCEKSSVSCNCTGKTDTKCCVMVCLKSLDQLRYALSLANKCCSLQAIAKTFSSESSCCNK